MRTAFLIPVLLAAPLLAQVPAREEVQSALQRAVAFFHGRVASARLGDFPVLAQMPAPRGQQCVQ